MTRKQLILSIFMIVGIITTGTAFATHNQTLTITSTFQDLVDAINNNSIAVDDHETRITILENTSFNQTQIDDIEARLVQLEINPYQITTRSDSQQFIIPANTGPIFVQQACKPQEFLLSTGYIFQGGPIGGESNPFVIQGFVANTEGPDRTGRLTLVNPTNETQNIRVVIHCGIIVP